VGICIKGRLCIINDANKDFKNKKKLIKVYVIYTNILERGEEFEEGFAEEAPLYNRLEISKFYKWVLFFFMCRYRSTRSLRFLDHMHTHIHRIGLL
jgi:hypothetical protein